MHWENMKSLYPNILVMVKPIELAKSEVSDKPYLVWNALIQLITESNHEDLNEIQSIPLFAFWYDSEIQNGGHLQYFENKLKPGVYSVMIKSGINLYSVK